MMFEPAVSPRVFSSPIGCDFAKNFVDGVLARTSSLPPTALARMQIFVNTRRMQRRVHECFLGHGALLLPQIHVITDIAKLTGLPVNLPAAVPPLRRRLQLAQLVKALLAQEPDLAPSSAVFDLAGSLATLLDEMQGEGVPFDRLESIKTGELSGHWERSLGFMRILANHWDPSNAVDPQDRQRVVAVALAEHWQTTPPDHPIIVAGSTGSRGASAEFMRAVAKLPQGAVILPGVDGEMPQQAWEDFGDKRVSMDHPQSSLFNFSKSLNLNLYDLKYWHTCPPVNTARNRLISLALRPAPFTDQWLEEGPALTSEICVATESICLVEAENPKDEARSIAVRLRKAAQDGQNAVLISPDRGLTRRVTTALARWGIQPDDSAGRPLHQTPPGVFLRLVAGCLGQHLTPLALASLLKHPLCASGEDGGGLRLLARNMERQELRGGAPFIDFTRISRWAEKTKDPNADVWSGWLRDIFQPLANVAPVKLDVWVQLHRSVAETLSAGPNTAASGDLWEKEAGRLALACLDNLAKESTAAGEMTAAEYNALLLQTLHDAEVREAVTPHPAIAIMGPREAREQGAELVILAGLNENIWPKSESPDPWLNRAMRQQVGLPPPERQIGLSAHDFQQAISAPEIVLSRSLRDGDAPTVASRWLIRLKNLMNGLGDEGKANYSKMKQRGDGWINLAGTLDKPSQIIPKSKRPSPCPPIDTRPKRLSVTRIKTLIRDPYTIYASVVLNLKPLPPLGRQPDALARGIALHEVLERFIADTLSGLGENSKSHFLKVAAEVLQVEAPWPAERRFWLARLARIADWFVQTEQQRRQRGRVLVQERKGERRIDELGFLLTAKADRIDLDSNGNLLIYDYKSGNVPSKGVIENFDKQLQLEAAIAEAGGFHDVKASAVVAMEYIGLGASAAQSTGKIHEIEMTPELAEETWQHLKVLISAYQNAEQGYTARARMQKEQDVSDYDHLSRRGEWEDSEEPEPRAVP